MTNPADSPLARTLEVVHEGIGQGLHLGGQLYVSHRGEPVADLAFGEVRPGEAMTTEHLMLWLSASKPVTAVALAGLWERGAFALDDPVAHHIPAFAAGGKEAVTVRHLLTHTGGIRMFETGWPEASWEEILTHICARKLEPSWRPGRTAGYHEASSWFVLGELIRRLSGRPFELQVREDVLQPLRMADSWIGMPARRYRAYGDRIAPTWDMEKPGRPSHGWESEPRCTHPSPGGNGRGPVRELGRFYEMLLGGGESGGNRMLTPQTVEALTCRHRVGLEDKTFRAKLDWGLGFILDSKHYGQESVPYGYGPHASPRTFGHSGYRSVVAFADPEHGLTAALAWNGTPSDGAHEQRVALTLTALYEDLGLGGGPLAAT
ncbi:MAG: serine hydrolase domain-containing protein [Thermoanaerobaculia bacterium]